MQRKRKALPPKRVPAAGDDVLPPTLFELDRFSTASLHRWKSVKRHVDALDRALYFGLDAQRQQHSERIQEALRCAITGPFEFQDWRRIVDYRYALEPLSVAGSLKSDGGRFNIGGGLNPGSFTPFPALYIAQDYETALRERFGTAAAGIEALDFALRAPPSFAQVRLQGRLESIIDISNLEALKPLAEVLRTFETPKGALQAARDLGLKPPSLVRSPGGLQKRLLDPNWRAWPVQQNLPANPQVFGRLVNGVGVHGILYPSARNQSHRCLALFPQNWAGSSSYVKVTDASPPRARLTRLDGMSRALT